MGSQAKPEGSEHLLGPSNRNPGRGGTALARGCAALSAMPSAGKTTRQTPMSGCVPGRGQCHPPGTSLPSAAASEPHPNLLSCERPGMLPARRLAFLFFFFSRYFLYFSWFFFFPRSSKPGFVCLFFKSKGSNPSIVRNLTGNNPCAQKCSGVPRRGNVCLSPLYNHADGTQGHCSLRPASKESFGVRKLQPCGVVGMGEVGVRVVRSVQFGFWEWGASFWKRAARRGQR